MSSGRREIVSINWLQWRPLELGYCSNVVRSRITRFRDIATRFHRSCRAGKI